MSDVTYSTDASLGGPITLSLQITNSGASSNPGTSVQVNDLDAYADLQGCTPSCNTSHLLGVYANFPGIDAGSTESYTITFIATKIGVANWSLCVYDSTSVGGTAVWCGSATTTIS